MTQVRPFRRGRFEELPERPKRPHPYFDVPGRVVPVRSAAFGDCDIHVRELGSGPPLLLVHGLMTTSYSWRYVLEPLSKRFRVIAPDLPGCGRSAKPLDRSYAPAPLAAFIGDLVRALGVEGCACVGNSMGGYLCMKTAMLDPRAFSRLVNVHSPGVPGARNWALQAALSVPGTGALLDWMVRRDPKRWVHRNVHYFDESLKSLEEASEYGDPLATREGAGAFAKYLAETVAAGGQREFLRDLASLRAFPIPLFLLYSRQDPMVPPSVGERLHALLPSARFEWLEGSSHFAHVDSPERVVPLLVDFLLGAPS